MYSEDEITIPHKSLHDVEGWKEFQESVDHIEPELYLYDIKKFSHKVYSQLDAIESEHRYVVWLDADVVVKQKLSERFLKNLTKDHFCAFLGRQNCYTETGFIVFDTKHEDFPEFKRRYRAQYDERLLFLQEYWIDCIAFDVSRYGLQARNLTPEVFGMVDVFSRSPLKYHLQHDKGNRKYRRGDEPLQEAV